MTTKDLLYLTAIAIVALLAYCHGFFSGFGRARKIYDSLLGEPECPAAGQGGTQVTQVTQASGEGIAKGAGGAPGWQFHGTRNRLSGQDLQGDFGNN
jgi:hypothetical protein